MSRFRNVCIYLMQNVLICSINKNKLREFKCGWPLKIFYSHICVKYKFHMQQLLCMNHKQGTPYGAKFVFIYLYIIFIKQNEFDIIIYTVTQWHAPVYTV